MVLALFACNDTWVVWFARACFDVGVYNGLRCFLMLGVDCVFLV